MKTLSPLLKGALRVASVAILLIGQTEISFGQPTTRIYEEHNYHVKNYSIINRETGTAPYMTIEQMMAGTLFEDPVASPEEQEYGDAINFKRVNNTGVIQYAGGSIVNREYRFPGFADVRCVDIVEYTYAESIVIVQARASSHGTYGNKDVIIVLKVDNRTGTILTNNILDGSQTYKNMYAMHGIMDGSDLFICGYVAKNTELPAYPDFQTQGAWEVDNKKIFVLKYDLGTTVTCNTFDYTQSTAMQPHEYADFDIALRLKMLSSGNIFVTGMCNADYNSRHRGGAQAWGAGTLSMIIDNNLNVIFERPFINEHSLMYWPHYRHNEYGVDVYESKKTAGGFYIVGNEFTNYNNPGTGFDQDRHVIGVTYVDNTLNFTPLPDQHRLSFIAVDWHWANHILNSQNGSSTNDRFIIAGHQSGWDSNGPCVAGPTGGNLFPSLTNINPFITDVEFQFTSGTNNAIGIVKNASNDYWHTFFTQFGTNFYNKLGGGLSNIYFPTEFATNLTGGMLQTDMDIAFTAPRWTPHVNLGNGGLNMKYTHIDRWGNQTAAKCLNSFQHCDPIEPWISDITDANTPATVDAYTVNVSSGSHTDNIFQTPVETFCNQPNGPHYKTTGINELAQSDDFVISPNPARGFVDISYEGDTKFEHVDIEIKNLLGQSVLTLSNQTLDGVTRVNLGDIAAGMYLINIHADGREKIRKISVE